MKTMNGFTNELLVKKAKRNWRTRCGAFLLAALAAWYGGLPEQQAFGQATLTTTEGWPAGVVIDTVQTENRAAPLGNNIGARLGYNINYNGDKSVTWTVATGHNLGVDLNDVTGIDGGVEAYRFNATPAPGARVNPTYKFNASDAFAANGSAFTIGNSMTWGGRFDVTGGTFHTGKIGNILTLNGNNAFTNTSGTFTINRNLSGNEYGGWLRIDAGGNNYAEIAIGTGGLSLTNNGFTNTLLGTITISSKGLLELGDGYTLSGNLVGRFDPLDSSNRGQLLLAKNASFNGNWSGSIGVTASAFSPETTPTGATGVNVRLDAKDVTNAGGLTHLYIYSDMNRGGSTEVVINGQEDVGQANIQLASNGYLAKHGQTQQTTINNNIMVVTRGGLNAYNNITVRDSWSTNPDSYAYDVVSRFQIDGQLGSWNHGDTLTINEFTDSDIGTVILTNTSNTFSGNFDIYKGTLQISKASQLGVHGHNYDDYKVIVGKGNARSAFRVVGGSGTTETIGHFFGTAGENGYYEVFTNDVDNIATLPDANRFTVIQAGKLLGQYDLNKAGDGRLVLGSVNSQGFTGDINIVHGVVSISSAANIGGSPLIAIGEQRASVEDSHLFRPVFETTNSLGLNVDIEINQENSVIRTAGSDNRTVLKGTVKSGSYNGETYMAALNKEGAGTLVLEGRGEWYKGAGALNIKQGTVEFSELKNLTTGTITIGSATFKDIETTEKYDPNGAAVDYKAVLKLTDDKTVSLTNEIVIGSVENAYIDVGTGSVLTVGSITESQTGSDLNKTGDGKLLLSAAKNPYTGWTNIEKGTIAVTQKDALVTSKGIDLIGKGATFDMTAQGAHQEIHGLRAIDPIEADTTDKREYHTEEWTRQVLIGDNNLTLALENFKTTAEATDLRSEFQGHIVGTGNLIKEGTPRSVFAGGFTGFEGGFVINTGSIETLTDTTLTSLTGKEGTSLDILDKTLTLNLGTSCEYKGTITSSTTFPWGSYGQGTIVKEGAGNLTAKFWDDSDLAKPFGFQGSLVLKEGNIISKSEYRMEGGNDLSFYANPDSSGKVVPLVLDARDYKVTFKKGGKTGEENSKVHVYMGDASTGWSTPKGNLVVGKIYGNDKSDYSGLEASNTDSLFHTIALTKHESNNRLDLHVNVNVTGFGGVGDTYNTIQVGENLDNIRLTDLSESGLAPLIQDLWAAGSHLVDPSTGISSDELKEERLLLIRDIFQQLSGDTIANAMFMGLDKPWQRPFDRLNLDSQMVYLPQQGGQQYRGQAIANMRNLWFTPSVQSLSARSDGNARKFGIDRPGYQIGFDKRVAQNTSVGFVLGYSSPKLHQGDDRVEASDFQFGLYGGAMVGYYVELKGFIGFGHQNFKSNRTVYLPGDKVVPTAVDGEFRAIGGNQRTLTSHGRFDGDTFNFSFEVSRPLFLGFAILRPTIGLDSEHAFRYGFTETGDATSMRFDRSSLSRTRARFGLGLETCTLDRAIFTGRIGYSCLLGGRDYAVVNGQFLDAYTPSQSIRSVAVGTSYFEAGVGTRVFLNPAKTLAFVGNYDASIGSRWAEHQAVVGFRYTY